MEMEMEIWKDVPGYEGLYRVSSFGRIKYCRTIKRRRKEHHSFNRYLKIVLNEAKYGYITLGRNGEKKKVLMHRLVALVFIPNIDNKPLVNHLNGIRDDNCMSNLEWCTQSENMQHAHKIGLKKSPIERPIRLHSARSPIKRGSWLEAGIVMDREKMTLRALAKKYGSTTSSICEILKRVKNGA